jgi:hypothetical protein
MTRASLDDEILVSLCDRARGVYRLNVDDFEDSDEAEITSEEIHITIVGCRPHGETTPVCLKLSTTSAVELVRQLSEAIAKRGEAASWE